MKKIWNTYRSVNSVLEVDDALNYPIEFLNSTKFIIMLLRYMSPSKLCNWTRLLIICLQKNFIEAIIMIRLIPRIPMISSDYPFQFKRMQFSIKVCFAI